MTPCPHGRYADEECPWCAQDALEGWRLTDPQPWGRFDENGADVNEIEEFENADLERQRDER